MYKNKNARYPSPPPHGSRVRSRLPLVTQQQQAALDSTADCGSTYDTPLVRIPGIPVVFMVFCLLDAGLPQVLLGFFLRFRFALLQLLLLFFAKTSKITSSFVSVVHARMYGGLCSR